MPHEIRLATFNVRNLAPPLVTYYPETPAYSRAEYKAKTAWLASQLDKSQADVIALQEIFSTEALVDVLEQTRYYKDAVCVSRDGDSEGLPITPDVALVSRLPLDAQPLFHAQLPAGVEIRLPGSEQVLSAFSRPILQAAVCLPNNRRLTVLVTHLKSRLPDFPEATATRSETLLDLACVRSILRRSADAWGLRTLICKLKGELAFPLVLLGDFNDAADAATTQLITGSLQYHELDSALRLYNAYELAPGTSGSDLNMPVPGTELSRIDHIYFSSEFTARSAFHAGRVTELNCFADHLPAAKLEQSDHALLMATLSLAN